MRRMHWIAGMIAVLTISGAYGTGCFFGSADDCGLGLECGSPTGSGTSTTSSSGGGGSVVSDECVPSINTGVVPNDCGIFVALNGDDGNPGTQEKPKKTMGAAITAAKSSGGKLYACGQTFQEVVELPAGVALFGALDCMGGWSYKASQRTVIQGSADTVPLKMVKGAGEIRMEDVDVRAVDATMAGGSSIALIVDGATVTLSRCELTAGNGMAGEKGATPMDNVGVIDNPNDPSIIGGSGANACMGGAAGNPGGMGKTNDLCTDSIGGNGGNGGLEASNGMNGTDGAPASGSSKGKGGAGDSGTGCEPGGYGQDGAAGAPGAGAASAEVGTLTAQGYVGAAGAQGTRGVHGQAGGGGGGGKGKLGCNGPSGGGGGAGGCGGFGGFGGTAGGASIAIISINGTISFTDVKLKTGNGAAGGDGGEGQLGGLGGSGGNGGLLTSGTTKACSGGDGGLGGVGGQGGGGRGGHSLGIAFVGKAPPTSGLSVSFGMAGAGGLGADMSGNGAAGEAKNTLEFPAATP